MRDETGGTQVLVPVGYILQNGFVLHSGLE